jgi:hypothetical protein
LIEFFFLFLLLLGNILGNIYVIYYVCQSYYFVVNDILEAVISIEFFIVLLCINVTDTKKRLEDVNRRCYEKAVFLVALYLCSIMYNITLIVYDLVVSNFNSHVKDQQLYLLSVGISLAFRYKVFQFQFSKIFSPTNIIMGAFQTINDARRENFRDFNTPILIDNNVQDNPTQTLIDNQSPV